MKSTKAKEQTALAVQQPTAPVPLKWKEAYTAAYNEHAANCFILHHNVADYVRGTTDLRSYLCHLSKDKDIIVWFNPARGITFAAQAGKTADQMRERFIELTGLNKRMADQRAISQATGQPPAPVTLPKEASQALALFDTLLHLPDSTVKVALFIDYAGITMPAGELARMSPSYSINYVLLREWALDPDITAYGHTVTLVAANISDIHQDFRATDSRYLSIELPLPDESERGLFIDSYLAAERDIGNEVDVQMHPGEFARQSAGMTRYGIETICVRARSRGTAITRDLVLQEKQAILAGEFGDVITLIEPRLSFDDIGGYEYLKKYFRKNVIQPIQLNQLQRAPQGVLLLGPAGTGKSLMAQALAYESGMNCYTFNPRNMRSKWVGESERKLRQALSIMDALGGICFIDEIDQAIRRTDNAGDGGVSANEFRALLEWTTDATMRGRRVLIGATNRPDLIDSALKRPGRFGDAKLVVLCPDHETRVQVFRVLLRRIFEVEGMEANVTEAQLKEMATRTEGWTPAEIEKAVYKSFRYVLDNDVKTAAEGIDRALSRLRNRTQDVMAMTWLALEELDDFDYLPDNFNLEDYRPDAQKPPVPTVVVDDGTPKRRGRAARRD